MERNSRLFVIWERLASWEEEEGTLLTGWVTETNLQLQYLRSLDASCNHLAKIEGLAENKVEMKFYVQGGYRIILYYYAGTARVEALWESN